jgi:NADH-quinone oxidoreductase subunit J
MVEHIVFLGFAALMLFSALMVITRKNAVPAAVYLIVSMFCSAALYAQLGADFVAAIQILVYAGAIMVLFVFVIMLLNTESDIVQGFGLRGSDFAILGLTVISFVIMSGILFFSGTKPTAQVASTANTQIQVSNTALVGERLFVEYVWAFELASILILMAIVASIVIAKKDKDPRAMSGEQAHGSN